jgi:hypothetical protein
LPKDDADFAFYWSLAILIILSGMWGDFENRPTLENAKTPVSSFLFRFDP